MKKRTKIIGIILVIVFAYIYAHVAKTTIIFDKQVDTEDYLSLGVLEYAVEQEFICGKDSLDAVSVKCQLNGDVTDINLHMDVWDVETGKQVTSVDTKAITLKNGKFNVIPFETVTECKGKAYKVSFYNEGEKVEEGCGVGFFFQKETKEKTILSIAGEPAEGTLIMKTVTKGFDVETFGVLILLILYIIIFFKFLVKLFSR